MKANAISLAVGVFLGGLVSWYIQDGRIDAANSKTELAKEQKLAVESDLIQCQSATAMQNAAVEALQAKAKQAEQDMRVAQESRKEAERKADRVLQERTPANVSQCEAARLSFDRELERERGQ